MGLQKSFYICLAFSCIVLFGYDYDLIIIGAGTAGMKAAFVAHGMGKRIAVIEKKSLGGDRLLHGDIPYKILYTIARKIGNTSDMQQLGVITDAKSAVQPRKLFNHIAKACDNICDLMQQSIGYKKNIHMHYGLAEFIDNHTIAIGDKTLSSDKFLIATGSRSYIPDIDGIDAIPYLTQETFFIEKKLPRSMIIVGGGPLSIELASMLNKLGVHVTLIIEQSVLLPTFDYEIVESFTHVLLQKGISITCNMVPIKVGEEDKEIYVIAENKAGKECIFKADSIFFSGGSLPNVEQIKLENAGVATNKYAGNHEINYGNIRTKNAILTNPFLQTTAHNIYACGDVTGIHMVGRAALYQSTIAVNNMFNTKNEQTIASYTNVPKYFFALDAEFGSIGMTEQEALKKLNNDVLIYRYDYHTSERAYIENNTFGMAKFICNKKGMLLGVHVLGRNAQEIINNVYIGQRLNTLYNTSHSTAISFNYQDILYEVSLQCAADIQKNTNISPGIVNTILSLFD